MKQLKFLLMLFAILAGFSPAMADELTVYDGTVESETVPMRPYYGDVDGQKCEFIIPAETLSDMVGATITAMQFQLSSAATIAWTAEYNVFVKEVEESTFNITGTGSIPVIGKENSTIVYSGAISPSGTTVTITFAVPYEYLGGNLAVGVYMTKTGNYEDKKFRGVTATNASWAYAGSSKGNQLQNFIPKTTFIYDPVVEGPGFKVKGYKTGGSYSFGMANPGATTTFTMTNPGTEAVTVDIAATDGFTANPNQVTIEAKGEATVTITAPESTANGTVTFTPTADGLEPVVINLSCTVKDPDKVFVDFADNALPAEWTTVGLGSSTSYSGYNWDFSKGYAWYKKSTSYSGSLSNYYNSLVSPLITFAEGERLLFQVKREAEYSSYLGYLRIDYSADGSTWTPVENGEFTNDVLSDDWQQKEVTIPTTAKHIRFVAAGIALDDIYGGELPQGARFAIDATDNKNISFGMVEQNSTDAKTFTITNNGTSDLTVDFNIPEGIYIPRTVKFTNNEGWQNVYFYACDANWNKLTGEWPGQQLTESYKNGYNEDLYPVTLPMGTHYIIFNDNAGNQTWDIDNLDVEGYYMTDGSDNRDYGYYGTNKQIVVAPGETGTLTIQLDTTTPGEKNGTVELTTNAIDITSFSIPVSGYVMDNTLFTETFDGNALPDGWETTGWTFADGEAYGKWKSSPLYQLITPNLTVADGEKMALEVKRTASTSCDLKVYVSKDGGAYSLHTTITNAELTDDYQVFYISGLEAGNYKLRFDGNDVKVNAVNGFHLDLNAPEMAVAPAEGTNMDAAFGKVYETVAKTYVITNKGTGEMTVNITSDSDDFTVAPTQLVVTDEPQQFTVTFNYDADNLGQKAGVITVTPTYNEALAVTISASANAKDPNLWEEDFENGIPEGFTNSGFSTSNWNHGGEAYASYSGGTLITPRLYAEEGQVLQYDIIDAESGYPMTVEWSNNRDGEWTLIASYTEEGTMSFTAPAGGYYYLRFSGKYVGVDNFYGFKLSPAEHDASITAQSIPTSRTQYGIVTATVTVKEMAGKEETLTARFFIDGTQYGDEVTEVVAANSEKTFTVTFTPEEAIEAGEAYFTVSNDDISLQGSKVTITISPAITFDEETAYDGNIPVSSSSTDFKDVVVLKYQAKAGWNTICVPFRLTDADLKAIYGDNYKIYEFKSNTNGALTFATPTYIAAGYPYLVYTTTPVDNEKGLVMKTIQIPSNAATPKYDMYGDITFQGTYDPINAPDMAGKYGIVAETGQLMKGGEGASLKGYRAYFDIPADVNPANLTLSFDDGTVITAIDDLRTTLFGEQGAIYDMQGRKVADKGQHVRLPKGVYIQNGKKITVR